MADTKISALTAATTPLAGTEVLPIVQSGVTKKVSVADLTAGRAVSMASATITGDLTVDTNTLYVDSTNNRVGVGTTSPLLTAHVKSSGSYPAGIESTSAYALLGFQASGTSGSLADPNVGVGANANDLVFRSGGVIGAKLDSSYNLTLIYGNLIQGTAAKGINFTANTGAAGKTSQLLNWYEEGTWTPANTNAVTVNKALYTRIGRQVTCTFSITAGGSATINDMSGLPFTPNGHASGVVSYQDVNGTETWSVQTTNVNVTAWGFWLGSTQKQLSAGKSAVGVITFMV